MKERVYFTEKELRKIEEAVYDILDEHKENSLNGEMILEELFRKGFSFGKYSKNQLKRMLIKYLKNWSDYELKKLNSIAEKDLKTNFRIDNLLILQEFLFLAVDDLTFRFNEAFELGFKLIREREIRKFVETLYQGIFNPTQEALERTKKFREGIEVLFSQKEPKGLLDKYFKENDNLDDEELTEEIFEEQIFEEENQGGIEITDYHVFSNIVESLIDNKNGLEKEKIKQIFNDAKVNFDKITDNELILELFNMAKEAVEREINEDEYIAHKFYSIDFDDIYNDCVDIDDHQSKDCRLVYLFNLWSLSQRPIKKMNLKRFEFFESRLKFTVTEKNLIEFIKEEIKKRRVRQRKS